MLAEVMHARPRFPTGGLEADPAEHADEQFLDHDARVGTSAVLLVPEEAGGRLGGGAGLLTGLEIGRQRGDDAWRKRQTPRLEKLRFSDLNRPVVHMHIADGQSRDLAEPKPRTRGQHHHRVQTQRA
jgi:hypothetical protein